MRSILSGQELTRMLALIAGRPGRANTTTAKCGTAISPGFDAKAALHALEDRQASDAIDQVDQASTVDIDVVAADALGP